MSRSVCLLLIFFVTSGISVLAQYRATEWEAREKWQNTPEILSNLDLGPSMHVADIGCHEGYLTMKLSPLVGEAGKVYAVDIEKYKLNRLDKRLKEQGISNVETILGDPDDPKLPTGRLDRIVILDTYHEIEDYQKVLRHIYQSLKPGGKLVLIEPIAHKRESWTRKEQADKHEISIRYAIQDLNQAGFHITKKLDPFIQRKSKSDRMWMMVATRPEHN